ncbi:MAG TPA: DUF4150 domain-containing protein [Anaeromyxobacteraceae bacterium]|nr:DUF4150 domain-containing protein [Anaeromyxobacteraceae bacterium]
MNFVLVNALSVVHKGSDGVATASAPDVCQTPSPGGPVPLPYPDVAQSSDLADGTTSVAVLGNPVAVKDSCFATSTGDEAGSAGGVVSGVTKGKAKFANYSFDVKLEGKNACRLGDPMTMNGNAPNTATVAEVQANAIAGKIGQAAFDDLCRAFCWCDQGKDPDDLVKVRKVPPPGPAQEA